MDRRCISNLSIRNDVMARFDKTPFQHRQMVLAYVATFSVESLPYTSPHELTGLHLRDIPHLTLRAVRVCKLPKALER